MAKLTQSQINNLIVYGHYKEEFGKSIERHDHKIGKGICKSDWWDCKCEQAAKTCYLQKRCKLYGSEVDPRLA